MTDTSEAVAGRWCGAIAQTDLSNEDVVGCVLHTRDVAIYRIDEAFFATSNICTHALALLSDGLVEGHTIECPLHNGRFDIRTGKALTSPVEVDLETYRTRIKDGQIEVFIPD